MADNVQLGTESAYIAAAAVRSRVQRADQSAGKLVTDVAVCATTGTVASWCCCTDISRHLEDTDAAIRPGDLAANYRLWHEGETVRLTNFMQPNGLYATKWSKQSKFRGVGDITTYPQGATQPSSSLLLPLTQQTTLTNPVGVMLGCCTAQRAVQWSLLTNKPGWSHAWVLHGPEGSAVVSPNTRSHSSIQQQQQQTFKVWQPQRAARSKRPNTPSDGSKHNGFQTTNQAVLIPKHVSRQDRAHDQEHHPLLHRLQWHGKQ